MGKKDNIRQFQYDVTLVFKGEKGSHSIEVPCLLSIKVKDQSPEAVKGTAWVNSATEPKSKAWLYCKFTAQGREAAGMSKLKVTIWRLRLSRG